MKLKLTFGNGLNADALPSELGEGFVNACIDTRFRNGFAEVIGGKSSSIVSYSDEPAWLGQLYTRTATYIVGVGSTAGSAGVYTLGGAASVTDITRRIEGVTISNATAAGTTVTITTSSAHGRSTGNIVSAWGFIPSTYNVESASITVTSATTFTYVVPSAPAVSPATSMGMYSRAGASNFTSSSPYTGGDLNGVLIINSVADGCYYWAGDTTIPVRKIVGSYNALVGIPFGNFVVQLAPVISGTRYSSRICWSDAAEPGSVPTTFTAATGNQAGDVDKPEIGELVFAKPLGDDLIVYGTRGRIVMRYIGGNDVFQFTKLPGEEGLYSTTTVSDFPGGHVFVDLNRRILAHSGGVCEDISTGRVQSLIGAGGNPASWVVSHPRQNEMWIGYATALNASAGSASTYALIWNWKEKTWGRATVDNEKFGLSATPTSSVATSRLLFVGASGSLQEYDTNESNTTDPVGQITRYGIDAGDSDTIKNLQRSRWNVDNVSSLSATFGVKHGSSMYADTSPTMNAEVAYTVGTSDYVASRATGGRFMAVQFTIRPTASAADPDQYSIRVRSADLDFTTGGKR